MIALWPGLKVEASQLTSGRDGSRFEKFRATGSEEEAEVCSRGPGSYEIDAHVYTVAREHLSGVPAAVLFIDRRN